MANTIGFKDSNGVVQPRLLDPTGVASALGNGTLAADVTALKDEIDGITGNTFTETDPTVPDWAKAENKPSYAVSEITGAASADDLAAEATAREQADATLQAAIDAEKARSEAVDEAQGIALDNQVSKAEEEHAEIGGRIDGVITNLETNYVPLTGATMTGGLVLNADAADPLGAVTKQQLDAAIAANKTKSLTFHGLISMTEPTVDMHAGDFWYQPAAVGEAPDTNFPWNVRSYINGAWTEETEEYTPETLDLWRYVDIATGFYYIGGIWNILNYDADSFGTDFEIIDGVVNIAKGSIVNSDLAENAAIAQSKLDLNIDTHPIEDSANLVQSGGVYAELANKANIADRGDLSALTTSDKSTLVNAVNSINVAKADKAIGAVVGNLLAADANGNHVDSGDFATPADLAVKIDKNLGPYMDDLNALPAPYIGGYHTSALNKPSNMGGYITAVNYADLKLTAQTAVDSDGAVFTRVNKNSADNAGWTVWAKQATAADLAPYALTADTAKSYNFSLSGGTVGTYVKMGSMYYSRAGRSMVRILYTCCNSTNGAGEIMLRTNGPSIDFAVNNITVSGMKFFYTTDMTAQVGRITVYAYFSSSSWMADATVVGGNYYWENAVELIGTTAPTGITEFTNRTLQYV